MPMPRKQSLGLLAVVIVAGGLGIWAMRSAGVRAVPDRPAPTAPVRSPGTAPAPGPSQPAEPARTPAPPAAAASRPPPVEELRRRVPAEVKPEEYEIRHIPDADWLPQPWIREIVIEVGGIDLFDEPPFSARWMFGKSDRAWLDEVRASYRAALETRLASGSGNVDEEAARRSAAEEVRPPYRALLRDVAKARLAGCPELQQWFFDGRRLADLPRGSEQHIWLLNVLRRQSPHSLFLVDLNRIEDMEVFAATDLPEIVRLDLEVQEVLLPYRDRTFDPEENDRVLRPLAERFSALVESRRR